jgi:hypothetical protein
MTDSKEKNNDNTILAGKAVFDALKVASGVVVPCSKFQWDGIVVIYDSTMDSLDAISSNQDLLQKIVDLELVVDGHHETEVKAEYVH